MKTLYTLLLVLSLSFTAPSLSAQILVDRVNINDLDITYCKLRAYYVSLISKNANVNIYIDYGQEFRKLNAQRIQNPDGSKREFHSIIDAFNFMEKNGWEYIDHLVAEDHGMQYLFRRKNIEQPGPDG